MNTFAEMFQMIWKWVAQNPMTVLHFKTEPTDCLTVYRSTYYVGFQFGSMDFCRHLED